MKLNEGAVVVGRSVVLLPYKRNHVEKYHSWMQSPEIQESTASEPLTLEQEYAMQRSWREDNDKLTFIVIDKSLWDAFDCGTIDTKTAIEREESCMVGDVNLFINDETSKETAEIEIMIAEVKSRSKGLATESLQLMMAYSLKLLGIYKFVAKIGCKNTPSINLFTRKLGYKEESLSAVFDEVSMIRTIDSSDSVDIAIYKNFGISDLGNKIVGYNEFISR